MSCDPIQQEVINNLILSYSLNVETSSRATFYRLRKHSVVVSLYDY